MLGVFALAAVPAAAGGVLCLDSCRALALRNNRQVAISELQLDVARNVRKSARTKYLPRVSAVGTYMYNSRELSILNDNQKQTLSTIGTTATSGLSVMSGCVSMRSITRSAEACAACISARIFASCWMGSNSWVA